MLCLVPKADSKVCSKAPKQQRRELLYMATLTVQQEFWASVANVRASKATAATTKSHH